MTMKPIKCWLDSASDAEVEKGKQNTRNDKHLKTDTSYESLEIHPNEKLIASNL